MSQDEKIYEDDVYNISSELCGKLTEIIKLDKCCIIDHVITSERIFNLVKSSLMDKKFLPFEVTCPREFLKESEKSRKNRHIGMSEASLDYLYPKS